MTTKPRTRAERETDISLAVLALERSRADEAERVEALHDLMLEAFLVEGPERLSLADLGKLTGLSRQRVKQIMDEKRGFELPPSRRLKGLWNG